MVELDADALQRLRRLIAASRRDNGRTVPSADVIQLSQALGLPGRLVIDLAAAEELGQPMVVFQVRPQRSPLLSRLTAREGEVAALLAAGLGNKEIAARLRITTLTVKDHVHHILEKTGLPSRAAIAALVMRGQT
jgi:DNA-binding NarL/FixJ family response regulator